MWVKFKDLAEKTALMRMDDMDLVHIERSENALLWKIGVGPFNSTQCAVIAHKITYRQAEAAVDEIFKRLANGYIVFDLAAWLEEYEEVAHDEF